MIIIISIVIVAIFVITNIKPIPLSTFSPGNPLPLVPFTPPFFLLLSLSSPFYPPSKTSSLASARNIALCRCL